MTSGNEMLLAMRASTQDEWIVCFDVSMDMHIHASTSKLDVPFKYSII